MSKVENKFLIDKIREKFITLCWDDPEFRSFVEERYFDGDDNFHYLSHGEYSEDSYENAFDWIVDRDYEFAVEDIEEATYYYGNFNDKLKNDDLFNLGLDISKRGEQ